VQEVPKTQLGQTETIPRSNVEIANAYLPCGFERGLCFFVGMLVELLAQRDAA
jgi:hypothetical protein